MELIFEYKNARAVLFTFNYKKAKKIVENSEKMWRTSLNRIMTRK